ncbi:hypothetical protein J5N97_022977 [Dioscorea zingiberensis]|uniref:Uncharacterized protein n=1 Tax=Dioscorea zingiberensis TaxID=325984 RepID=A0A9D5CCB4_9LILI|nr:hypothetical protein J5N97_022977 [Dioscorea zingiberensis]
MNVAMEGEVVVTTPIEKEAIVIENNIKQEVISKRSSKDDDIELVEHDSLDQTDKTTGYPSSPQLFWTISHHKSWTKKCNACKLKSWSGLPVIMVTLMLIMFLSRAWAIVCLSLWFYVLALLRGEKTLQYVEEEDINKMDMDIVEYKKKVISQGLLRRSKPKAMATTTLDQP